MCRSDTSETKTQQKRAFPPLSYGFSSALLFPTLSPPLSPLLQFDLIFCLSSVLNIVSCLSPPPHSFAVWRLHIEYLLLVLLGSVVGICYIVRYKLNYCICRQTDFIGKRSLPLRLQRPDGSALNGLPKPFTLFSFVLTFLSIPHGNISLVKMLFLPYPHYFY